MIKVKHLSKQYADFHAVKDISFEVEKGEILGFLGPNGAGKSTTMRILTCFMPATSGTATIGGYDVFKDSLKARQTIGYLPENVPLYTKTADSDVYYAAGWYCINFEKGWKHSHGPKYSTLVNYGYAGPFKTEIECRQANSKLNKEKRIND